MFNVPTSSAAALDDEPDAAAVAARRTQLRAALAAALPAASIRFRSEDTVAYECDGLTAYRATPLLVVLPDSEEQVAAVLRICHANGVPVVARGAGTGLSGGALPHRLGVTLSMAKFNRILAIDPRSCSAVVQCGVRNLAISEAAAPHGLYYAPDPSSQIACTIGGNVAENSGGVHCLKYGLTLHNVLRVRGFTAGGEAVAFGAEAPDAPGLDLLPLIVGSEGMLAIVTEVWLRVLRLPEKTRTIFATFATTGQAGDAVSAIVARGIVPAAVEMMDGLAIEAIVSATGVDWPLDAGAALLIDVDGIAAEVEETAHETIALMTACGAIEVRSPHDDEQRALMWKGRKGAFAAMGRISPNYYVQDGVIPRKEIAAVLREIAELASTSGLRVANVFHAGDGNLHPLVLYDARVAGEEELAERVGGEILRICIDHGGSITGEHGVGLDKAVYMSELFTDDDLETMNMLRCAFDPERALNPGKVFPTPRLCGDRPGPFALTSFERDGVAGRG